MAKTSPRLCFVLLKKKALPTTKLLAKAFTEFPELGEVTITFGDEPGSLTLSSGKTDALVMLMPVAVPNGEADGATDHSLSGLSGSWALPKHTAHLVVVEGGRKGSLDNLVVFTRLVAGLVNAMKAVGLYWGAGRATHHPNFVNDMARSELPLPLWVGVSIAVAGKRTELLSAGMEQLGLPNLLLDAKTVTGDELEFFYDLLAYVARRGKKLTPGETVGRNAKEKLKVRYEPSPIEEKAKVWCVSLK